MYQLVYISAACVEFDDEALEQLLSGARENNAILGVSGMLLFHEGSFIQVLEGPQTVVEALFEKIEQDPRHEHTEVLFRGDTDEACFEDWSMGYVRTPKLTDVPEGFHPFLTSGFRRNVDENRQIARKALLAFKGGRWRQRLAG